MMDSPGLEELRRENDRLLILPAAGYLRAYATASPPVVPVMTYDEDPGPPITEHGPWTTPTWNVHYEVQGANLTNTFSRSLTEMFNREIDRMAGEVAARGALQAGESLTFADTVVTLS